MTIKRGPKSIQISVTDGQISYDAPNLRAFPGELITWTCSKGPFALQFLEISPLPLTDYQGNPAKPVSDTIVAEHGTYSYACAVYDPEAHEVYMDAACPAIIIQR